MKNITKLSEQDLRSSSKSSWHDQYRDSAWVFIGGLPYELTEGDIICIFSQYGEIVNINLIRDKDSGKSKGFCFLCYEDQRSTVLAVDNLNGIKILNRAVRVDHVSNYKIPKQGKKTDVETKKLYDEGCAPMAVPIEVPPTPSVRVKKDPDDFRATLADQIESDIRLPARLPIHTVKKEKLSDDEQDPTTHEKKEKKLKKDKKKKKKKKKSRRSSESDSDSDDESKSKKKKKKKSSKRTASDSESDQDIKRKRK